MRRSMQHPTHRVARHRPRRAAVLVALVATLLAACAPGPGGDDAEPGAASGSVAPGTTILVAAASDLRPAFEALGERFTAETGVDVTFDFGSSGQLAQRIVEGAPVDLFASANAAFVDQVVAEGVGDPATRSTYAFGRLVIWSTEDRWADWERPADLAGDDDVVHLAIANPEHAPYGLAAEQVLAAEGVLAAVRDRLVLGENVSDTQRLIETGNADVGIIALSLALAADERDVGAWVPVDEALHDPLQQDLVVTARDDGHVAAARAFADLVASDAGREVMRRYGFLLPGEEAA